MKRCRNRASRSALVLLLGVAPLGACDPTDPQTSDPSDGSTHGSETDSDSATSVADTETPIGWFEIGWGDGTYVPLGPGDAFPVVLGGQGLEMFPMPLRGGEFFLPANPTSWMDETGPLVDIEMDVEGFNDGPFGHFKRIANHTLDWEIREDGSYQSEYLPIIVPDGIDVDELVGRPAHLWVRVRPHEQPELELELDVVIEVMSSLED
ncbi:MAG: hypothetical protein AAGF11_17645 [Myxococcota bacterium]